ncbi:hypothetical protein [Novosphingobium album (ex Hu et al. 2023)]|uniref:Uncharacterized protein n=1 Tax=Novosphingobium album (ex Hu et al. 2023) TaxID=2930093 RepID=A0ABT0B6I6_9SPHN|nr:hypothetical protein [Novosphingobium album (ex Hu et al. 2023)]MCJ2180697.1 hypothetical protein [Novosphingobium album (ex Hu et al. 2023)]
MDPTHPNSNSAGHVQFERESASVLSLKWSALHDAAQAVAAIAGADAGPLGAEVRNFPAAVRDAGNGQRARAEQGIEDLSALMEAGLAALLSAMGHEYQPRGAAQALWREFVLARDALLQIVSAGSSEPREVA